MKLTQSQALMALVAVTLIASGCTQPDPGGGEGGEESDVGSPTAPIQITEFSAYPNNPAPAGNTVTFTLELRNTGSISANNVMARLWNPPFASEGSDTRTWRNSDGGAIRDGDQSDGDRRMYFGELRGKQEGVEAFAQPENLQLTAPVLDDGQEFPYNFHAKIFYEYRTEGSTTVTAMDNEQYRETNGDKTRSVSISHNDAPITLSGVLLAGNPIVFYEDNNNAKTPEFCVVAKNSGPGQVFKRTDKTPITQNGELQRYDLEGSDAADKVKLKVTTPGTTKISKNGNSYSNSVSKTVELVGGDKKRYCFNLRVQPTSSQKTVGPINVQAKYGYVKDTSTKVTVAGR